MSPAFGSSFISLRGAPNALRTGRAAGLHAGSRSINKNHSIGKNRSTQKNRSFNKHRSGGARPALSLTKGRSLARRFDKLSANG